MVQAFLAGGRKYKKNIFPRAWIEDTVYMRFEDADFPISSHYDALLTQLYGDWHTPSPLAERKCKEHVAILDLERPHTEYLEIQQTMRIEDHTRSIR